MQAIVLAGGKGQRLRPLTETLPKAMITVAGKPLIHHHLEWLQREGVTDAVIACGYLGECIQEYLVTSTFPNLNITFSWEDRPLGRGGAARKAFTVLPHSGDMCVISQADVISDMPLADAYKSHAYRSAKEGIALTMLMTPYRSRHGVAEIDDTGRVIRFREKPRLPYWANTGTFIVSPVFFDFLPAEGDEDATIELLAAKRIVAGFCTNHYARTIDTAKDLQELSVELVLTSLPHEETF